MFFARLVAIFVAALWMVRFSSHTGFQSDINTFWTWALRLPEVGAQSFYQSIRFCDYQPLYLYVLWVIGRIISLCDVGWGSASGYLLIKSPAILAHLLLVTGVSIPRFYDSSWFTKGDDSLRSFLIFLCVVFNPALTYNAAIWGQIDPLFNLLLAVVAVALLGNSFLLAGVAYCFLFALKPHALFFVPFVFLVLARDFALQRSFRAISQFIFGFLPAFGCLYLPFWFDHPSRMFGHYAEVIKSYPRVTLNAFNLYFLGNWNQTNLNTTAIFGISIGTLATVLFLLSICALIFWFGRCIEKNGISALSNESIMAISVCFAFAVFLFAPKMHERYSIPALGLMIFLVFRNRNFFIAYLLLSFTTFLNQDLVLDHFYGLKRVLDGPTPIVCSILNLCCFALLLFETTKLIQGRAPGLLTQGNSFFTSILRLRIEFERWRTFKLVPRDWILLVSIAMLSLMLNLFQLGASKIPELREWPSKEKTIYFSNAAKQLLIFGFTDHDSQLVVKCKEGKEVKQNYQAYAAMNWVAIDLPKPCAQTATLTWAGAKSIKVGEVILRDKSGSLVIIDRICEKNICQPAERDSWYDEGFSHDQAGSYYVQTIFDEVYYGRAVMELREGIFPFESTHPPLGKLIGYAASYLVAFSPLSWRLPNAILGAMIPLLVFFFLRELTFSRGIAFFGMTLSLFDMIRVSLSRLYTIDVPVSFFILCALIFSLRYLSCVLHQAAENRRIIPLIFTAIFAGLAIATKWNAVFALVTVFVIFLVACVIRFLRKRSPMVFADSAILICIPALIYFLSYVPYMYILKNGFSVAEVISNQFSMYNYHAYLTATHPFQSKWNTWPFVEMPLWEHVFRGVAGTESLAMMGNPAIWWMIAVSVFFVVWSLLRSMNLPVFFCFCVFLLQYLPWIIASRATFIYHFFVPSLFGIALVAAASSLLPSKVLRVAKPIYLCLVVCLFALFWPVFMGTAVDPEYFNKILRWFGSWQF